MTSKMATTKWDTIEAFETDLLAFSEIEVDTRKQDDYVSTPPAISQYYARIGANNHSSIFAPLSNLDEDVTYVISGRGRGRKSTIYRPGGKPQVHDENDSLDIKQKIREVSGMGCSNEFIEQVARTKISHTDNKTPEKKSAPFKAPSSSSNSITSSRLQSPMTNNRLTPTPPLINFSNDSSKNPSPVCIIEEEDISIIENPQPPPLSMMRSLAKKKKEEIIPEELDDENDPIVVVEPEGSTNKNSKCSPIVNAELEGNINEKTHESDLNNFWWENSNRKSRIDEPNSWRRRDNNSPNRFFNCPNNWCKKPFGKNFDIHSREEFPKL